MAHCELKCSQSWSRLQCPSYASQGILFPSQYDQLPREMRRCSRYMFSILALSTVFQLAQQPTKCSSSGRAQPLPTQ